MKKELFILMTALVLLLAGCSNTPDTVSIQATVDSAVSTAMAPYEERYGKFITDDDLTASQTEQNQAIQQYIVEQIDRAKEDLVPVPTEQTSREGEVYIDNGSGAVKPTQEYAYNNDPECVDRFSFVSDMTIPDGMTLTPYTTFTKSWYITNSGECTWNSNYKVVYMSGAELGTQKSFSFLQPGYFIKPGESVMVSADMSAPYSLNTNFDTYWAIESDRGEKFGSGAAKNVYLSAKIRVEENFLLSKNYGSIQCADDYGYFTCGSSASNGGRGAVSFVTSPLVESRIEVPSAVAMRPAEVENGKVRIEFGPVSQPRGGNFYTNFSCKPDTPLCETTVRLYVRPRGGNERLIAESREYNDGYVNEWKFILDDKGIYDQDFTYIIEVQADGGVSSDDTILVWYTAVNHP